MSIPGSVDNGEVDVEYTPDPDHRQSAQELWFRGCDKRIRHLEEATANVAIGILEIRRRAEAQDKRISSLELQVHRLLNPDDAEPSDLTAAYMKGYADGKAEVAPIEFEKGWRYGQATVTRTEGDYAHVPGPEWEALKEELETLRSQRCVSVEDGSIRVLGGVFVGAREWKKTQDELEFLRSGRPDMDEHGVTLSHDAYDMLEREAAIGRSVPWAALEEFLATVTYISQNVHGNNLPYAGEVGVRAWLAATAPKESAE